MMCDHAIRLLLIEDNPADVALIQRYLSNVDDVRFVTEVTDSLATGLGRLAERDFDAVLLDLFLPDGEGLETFDQVARAAPLMPILILTGLNDRKVGAQAVRKGAQDFLV